MSANAFLLETEENGDFNQYWYSERTIARIVEALVENGGKIAFLSTPSLYFSLPEDLRSKAYVFDYDRKWESDRGFVFYDYRLPEDFPEQLKGSFDMVVVDPPFIVEEVWEKYAITSKLLLKKGLAADGSPAGKVILTTVFENAAMLERLLGAKPTVCYTDTTRYILICTDF
jgi:EEF1A lysine methyltransferase 1